MFYVKFYLRGKPFGPDAICICYKDAAKLARKHMAISSLATALVRKG